MEENKEFSVLKQRVKVLESRQQSLEESYSRDRLDRWKIISDLIGEVDKLRKKIEESEENEDG